MTAQPKPTTAGSQPKADSDDDAAKAAVARDSLRILPLSMVPLESVPLRRARMIKNVYLEGVVEFFRDASTGSGQLSPDELPEYMGWREDETHADLRLLRALASLNSYDVYSLRIELRRLGISVNDHSQLCLSGGKSRELAGYMKNFTGPLIQQVFGANNPDIQEFDQLISMFTAPDKSEALKNLKVLADKLEIDLMEVPRFLEDYGDTFLSLAYFQQCLDEVVPKVMDFLENIELMRANYQLRRSSSFMQTCEFVEPKLNAIITSMTGRFESFERNSKDLWSDISAESFRSVRQLVTEHHSTVGGVLCGLSVKMDAWDEKFGEFEPGSALIRRSEFVMSDMRRGLEKIAAIEASAPQMAAKRHS